MFITQITSYDNGWNTFKENFPELVTELIDVIGSIHLPISDESHSRDGLGRPIYRRVLEERFHNELEKHNWHLLNHRVAKIQSSNLSVRGIGNIKKRIAVKLHVYREQFNRWLYTIAPLAIKHDLIDLPIAITLSDKEAAIFGGMNLLSSSRITDELKALEPLSYNGPFIILGISNEKQNLVITELSSNNHDRPNNIIINRSLEFPPEHHQAGLGILSYFGTVLREKYPGTNSKIRIEQEGLYVRLIIESNDGNKEIIEKALEDYESVVRGDIKPEEFLDDKLKIMELKQEIRFAELRIHQQEDMIQFHREQVLTLTTLFGHSLSRASAPVTIDFKPTITLNSAISNFTELALPEILDELSSLTALSVGEPPLQLKILDLKESLTQLDEVKLPEEARKSSGLKKFKSFIEDASASGTSANNLLKTVEGGIDTLQSLARRYNSLAEWCGATQIPKLFVGKED
ncbi:hypothetical protein V2J67_10410 [Pseudomonas alliivorans]|nr:hypothetical protein [Pseudomonas alliivorans]